MLLAQNLILMGIFFTIPLFLQIVQGLDALETGVRMLPASVGLFVSRDRRLGPGQALSRRTLVRIGLLVVLVADRCCCSTRSSPNSTTPPSWSRWACSGSAWG